VNAVVTHPEALVSDARDSLARTHQLLLDPSPANVDLCCSHLAAATRKTQALYQLLSDSPVADRDVKKSAAMLRLEVLVVASLLDRAAAYHAGLLQDMIAASRSDAPAVASHQMARRVQLDG